jgi:uncharacterized protein YebE (UPF0316 family)
LESKLAVGTELVRAISMNRDVQLARRLRLEDYKVVELAGANGEAPVEVLLISEKRRNVPRLLSLVKSIDPTAVCTVSDIRRHVPDLDSQRSGPMWPLRYARRK